MATHKIVGNRLVEVVENRRNIKPVPDDISRYLTENQTIALARLDGIGWSIKFVRRFNVDKPMVVVEDPSGKIQVVLDEDGKFDNSQEINIR